MSDKREPCKWLFRDATTTVCEHPVIMFHDAGEGIEIDGAGSCHGCPCHEPADPVCCTWEQDWEGNWEASCGLCWGGDDIGGMNFCPNCGLPVTAVPYTEPKEDGDAVATD